MRLWHPELVHVRGYPKTQEKFDALMERGRNSVIGTGVARQLRTRKGIPDGWSGKGAEVQAIRAVAQEKAPKVLEKMQKTGLIASDIDPIAKASLEVGLEILLSKDGEGASTYQARERLQAMSKLLEYSLQKPASKSEVQINSAEAMLQALLDSEK
jgi:hypothetical protein